MWTPSEVKFWQNGVAPPIFNQKIPLSRTQAYEKQHVRMARKPGLGTLMFLLSENGLTASDLSRLLGSDISLGYRILSGEPGLTTRHIRKLAQHFRVGPEVLF
jgi:antitoxin component HigA of HigAB toxin-antitoxin module